ncbi:MAG: hypothetical protein IJ437_00415 [Clostridia bacterium]|nr:hypothetical protein [Clostridia bacterium]
MKKALKIFLAVILITTALISVFAMVCALASACGQIYTIIFKIANIPLSFFVILSLVINSTSLFLSAILSLLFAIIALGCIVSVLYIFVGSSDNRLAKIKAVIDEAYANSYNSESQSDEKCFNTDEPVYDEFTSKDEEDSTKNPLIAKEEDHE